MIKFDITTMRVENPVAIECDVCHKVFDCEEGSIDIFEVQEFHHVKFRGGYGSVFGDESRVECDICQRCLKKLIYNYCRVDGERIGDVKDVN